MYSQKEREKDTHVHTVGPRRRLPYPPMTGFPSFNVNVHSNNGTTNVVLSVP